VEGGSLRSVLQEQHNISWDRKRKYAYEIASGLECVHSHSRIHGDVKSANILVSSLDQIKIADFGNGRRTAKPNVVGRHGSSIVFSRVQAVCPAPDVIVPIFEDGDRPVLMGTVQWMAPEILLRQPFGSRADVYSYAIVLWEIASQMEPWADVEFLDLFPTLERNIAAGFRPEIGREWPLEYVGLMERCWSTVPDERPTFTEVLHIPMFSTPTMRLLGGSLDA
jgi:serine/threonine protein kinase